MVPFALRRSLDRSYDEVLVRLPEALKAEGFGVLTEVDVSETLKKKLGVEFRRYRILGACNPPFAHRALEAELEIGLMMPCNVIVFEAEGGRTVVAAVDPSKTMTLVGNPRLSELAVEISGRLERVLSSL
jgi:uncharacterized protein (DUF302 family)